MAGHVCWRETTGGSRDVGSMDEARVAYDRCTSYFTRSNVNVFGTSLPALLKIQVWMKWS